MMAKKKRARKTKPKRIQEPKKRPSTSVSWSGPEFYNPERGVFWYVSAFLIFAALELLSIFVVQDPIVSVAVPTAAALLVYHLSLKPRTLKYRIDQTGIKIGQISYRPDQLRSFWISYDPVKILHLNVKGRAMPILILIRTDEAKVKEELKKITFEDPNEQEDFLASVIRIFRL